ncbi:Imm10 family immunity protein [Streptomyces roseolus]|uniref:Imm10 family immunity protein n=1 Tax=Streptomyces roseolus TaxID=67358 RepID=UPI001674AB07|nr:Imm10 family immunity protein [Streptomyces roseolus]
MEFLGIPGQTFTVYISEGVGEDGQYFDLQRMLEEPGRQEIDLELDSYCVVTGEEVVDYGSLEEVELLPERLTLIFREESIDELELPSNVITLGIDSKIDVDSLREGLKKVLTYGNPVKVPRMNF